MSFSFSVRATDKATAIAKVREELAAVVIRCPEHSSDVDRVQATAESFLSLLVEDATSDVVLNISGSLGWQRSGDETVIRSANVSVSSWLETR